MHDIVRYIYLEKNVRIFHSNYIILNLLVPCLCISILTSGVISFYVKGFPIRK